MRGVAGLTAYQSIVPRVKQGDRVFINGGSGGVGCFGIQLAKVVGCHVTTSCSERNVELCRRLGADGVVDYTKVSVADALKEKGWKFDHVVDNVGTNEELIWSLEVWGVLESRGCLCQGCRGLIVTWYGGWV